MLRALLPAILVCMSVAAQAQQAKGTLYQTKLAGTTVNRDIEDKYNPYVYSYEAPSPDGNIEKIKLQKAKEKVAATFPRKASEARHKTTAAQSPVVVKSFVANTSPGTPPDNDFAVSKAGQGLSVINTNSAVIDAATGQISGQKSLAFFSSAAALGLSGRYDPKVQYDPIEDKFICVMLHDRDAANYIVVGFSQSNDPNGAWAWYKFYGDYKPDSTWFDYPGVAITNDEVFVTGNKIKFAAPWETGFSESVIYQINKKEGYAAATTLNYKIWDGIKHEGRSLRNLFPVRPGWMPDGNEQYFLSNRNFDVQNDTVFLVKVPGTLAQGGNVSITVLKSPLAYGVPPNGREIDTSVELATNDGRILGAYAMNDEIQFVSTSVDPNNGSSAVFHGKISNYKTSPAISHAQLFSIDTLDFGYPNISYTGNPWGLNQSIINFNYTGPGIAPGMGAIAYDGLSYSNMAMVKTGDSVIKNQLPGKTQRWGDYTATQVDYNSLGSVWIEGIYGRPDYEYGNWIVKLNSPSLGVSDKEVANNKNSIFPNPAYTYVAYRFDMQTTDEVTFAIYNVNGQLVDELITKKCHKGRNLVQFNTASLPAGNYMLKGMSATGGEVMTERFVKQ